MPDSTQYNAAAHVPLIQAPSLRIPQPVAMPQDIHPLPDTLEPYMVYAYTLEHRTLTAHAHLLNTLASLQTTHAQRLAAWEAEKHRRRREALRKVAPGFEPEGGTLVPTRVVGGGHGESGGSGAKVVGGGGGGGGGGPMDDLVEGLERMGYGENKF